MPKASPPEIAEFIREHVPPGHRMAWVRLMLMKPPVEMERPPIKSQLLMGRKPPIEHDTALELRDVDTGEGWDLRLKGVGHDIVMGDIFTAIGHVPPGEERVKSLPFLLNHKTGEYKRTYPDISTAGNLINELAYKRSLSFWSPASLENCFAALAYTLRGYYLSSLTPALDRIRNIILTCGAVGFLGLLLKLGPGGMGQTIAEETMLHPWLMVIVGPVSFLIAAVLLALLVLPLAVLGAFLYYLGVRIVKAVYEPPRLRGSVEYSFSELIGWDNIADWAQYCRVDQTYLYQEVAQMLHVHAQRNPDPKVRFVVGDMRGQGTKGKLAAAEPHPSKKAA